MWVAAEVPTTAAALEAAGQPRELAELLARRGADTPELAEAFLAPAPEQLHDPFLLAGMTAAVERLVQARERAETVAIVGDYDVDGVSGTALLTAALGACGITSHAIVPHRVRDGYGFQPQHVERAVARGCAVILTVDCGTTSTATIEQAFAAGLDVIVVDHHLPATDFPARAIQINPRQPDCRYPFPDLAAVGLALKLALALCDRCGRKVSLEALLRVACLGTIADLVPLRGENRVIAALGLRALAEARSPGLKALIRVAGVKPPLSAADIGFRLGPRINAAGRLDSAELALELLLTRDAERADELAEELDRWNRRRQGEEQQVVEEATAMFDDEALPRLLVGWSDTWHRGVVGIAAGRLARRFHRPTILLAVDGDTATGSGRSIEGIHLHRFLAASGDRLLRFGGHAQAIGLTARTAELEALRRHWIETCDWPDELLVKRYEYDLEIAGARGYSSALFATLLRLAPFGQNNREPLLRVGPLRALAEPRVFGNDHVQVLCEGRDGGRVSLLGWRWQPRLDDLRGWFEVLAHADWDDYLGAPILRLLDARCAVEEGRAAG